MPTPAPLISKDVIIIGAGWHGLQAAKTYLAINTSVDLTIIDSDSGVGGVWSRSRIYPRLVVNQPTPLFEYSDYTMSEAFGGVADYSDISGEMMCSYLEKYASKFNLLERCKFDTKVINISRDVAHGPWKLVLQYTIETLRPPEEWRCKKLIVAAGIDSIPKFPSDLNTSAYSGKTLHSKDIGKSFHELLADDDIKNVTIVGGNKSSFEIAGMFGLEGKKVQWLIREDGLGAGMMMKDRPDGKKHAMEAMKPMSSRLPGAIAPNLYTPYHWLTRFIYGGKNWFGRWFEVWLWKMPIKNDLKTLYPPTKPQRKAMKPLSDSMFWISAGQSMWHVNNRDDLIFDLIDEGKLLTVQKAAITSMHGRSLTLSNGSMIESDAVIWATGWHHPYGSMFDPALIATLGIPVPRSRQPEEYRKHWESLEHAAEAKIVTDYPILGNPPQNLNLHLKEYRHYARLYRFMVPPGLTADHDRSVVFLGNLHPFSIPSWAEIASLWAISYLEGLFPLNPRLEVLNDREEMERQAAYEISYFKLRYIDVMIAPVLVMEFREVCDQLVLDLGLRPDRKVMQAEREGLLFDPWGWRAWAIEWFSPYSARDYRGLIEEFKDNRRSYNGT